METIDVNQLVDLSLNLIFYFTIGSFGAFFKVLYESLTKKNYKIRIGKIIIGGGTTAILCAGLNYNLLHDYNIGTRFMIAAIVGILGFEIFGKIRSIEGLKDFIKDMREIASDVGDLRKRRDGPTTVDRKEDESDDKDNHKNDK